jgi:periplasmic protein TonB
MFAESTLETPWAQGTHRGWTTLTSFGLQILFIGSLLIFPLLRTIGIPLARTVPTPVTMGRSDPGPIRTADPYHISAVAIVAHHGRIMAPTRSPGTIAREGESSASDLYGDDRFPPDIGPSFGPPADIPIPVNGTHPVMPKPAMTTKPTLKTSTMLQGSLIRRVEPAYPPLARSARIQGPVVLEAVIGKDGTMQHLQLVAGHPMLVSAAVEAVRQWRYRPYILNGEAIEVETQITVNFVLAN